MDEFGYIIIIVKEIKIVIDLITGIKFRYEQIPSKVVFMGLQVIIGKKMNCDKTGKEEKK